MIPSVYIRDHSTLGDLRVNLAGDLMIPLIYLSDEESIKKAISEDLWDLISNGNLDSIIPCDDMSNNEWMFWEDHILKNIDEYAHFIWTNVKDK